MLLWLMVALWCCTAGVVHLEGHVVDGEGEDERTPHESPDRLGAC